MSCMTKRHGNRKLNLVYLNFVAIFGTGNKKREKKKVKRQDYKIIIERMVEVFGTFFLLFP